MNGRRGGVVALQLTSDGMKRNRKPFALRHGSVGQYAPKALGWQAEFLGLQDCDVN
jgi:hypothetical protein